MAVPMIAQAAPRGCKHRISSDSAWPLRRADGRPFHEQQSISSGGFGGAGKAMPTVPPNAGACHVDGSAVRASSYHGEGRRPGRKNSTGDVSPDAHRRPSLPWCAFFILITVGAISLPWWAV